MGRNSNSIDLQCVKIGYSVQLLLKKYLWHYLETAVNLTFFPNSLCLDRVDFLKCCCVNWPQFCSIELGKNRPLSNDDFNLEQSRWQICLQKKITFEIRPLLGPEEQK